MFLLYLRNCFKNIPRNQQSSTSSSDSSDSDSELFGPPVPPQHGAQEDELVGPPLPSGYRDNTANSDDDDDDDSEADTKDEDDDDDVCIKAILVFCILSLQCGSSDCSSL